MPTANYRELREIQGRPIKDKRHGGDRHKKERKDRPAAGGKALTKWQRRKIVAWDGEGANL